MLQLAQPSFDARNALVSSFAEGMTVLGRNLE